MMARPNTDLAAEPLTDEARVLRLERENADLAERLQRLSAAALQLQAEKDAETYALAGCNTVAINMGRHIADLEQQIALLRPGAERAEERRRDMEVTRHTLEDLITASRPRKRVLEAALARIACLESEHASRVVERNEALERARQVDAALLVAVAEGNALRVAAVRAEQLEQETDRARAREESLQTQIRALQTELDR